MSSYNNMLDPAMTTMTVAAWDDPLVEARGFGPLSSYVEFCWLPILGPTTTWLYRRLAMGLLVDDEYEVDLVDLGVSLGVGEGTGKHAALSRGLCRMTRFGVATPEGSRLLVRRALAPLTGAQVSRLSYSAYVAHERLTGNR